MGGELGSQRVQARGVVRAQSLKLIRLALIWQFARVYFFEFTTGLQHTLPGCGVGTCRDLRL